MPLTALAFAFALHQLVYPLRWEPKKGESFVYDYFLKDKETSVEAAIKRAVKGVKKDGSFEIESRSLGALVRTGASEVRDDRPNASTATFDPSGHLVAITGGIAGLAKYRFAILTSFVAPPKAVVPSDSWKSEREKDRPAGLSASSVTYTFKSVTDGVAEVGFVSTESSGAFPQSATGTWWIDARTGLALKFEAKVKNFVGSEGAETELRLTLRKPK